MAYTVKKLAAMSGVSVRTLHWYDSEGLLKPARYSANGYRLYEETQLLTLQQILFYRELGFDLRTIKSILGRSDFDRMAALESHRGELLRRLARTRELIRTIDKTLRHMRGLKTMKNEEIFTGFDPKEQERHERYLVDRYGAGMKECFAESHARVKSWSKAKWAESGEVFGDICRDLVGLIERRKPPESREALEIIRRHFEWLKQFWTPNRESYAGHGQFIVDSELRQAYARFHPALPEFVAAAIKRFAESELT